MTFKCHNTIYERHAYFEPIDGQPDNVGIHYCQDDTDTNRVLLSYLNGTRGGQGSDMLIRFSLASIVSNTIEAHAVKDGRLPPESKATIDALRLELERALAMVNEVVYQEPPPKPDWSEWDGVSQIAC